MPVVREAQDRVTWRVPMRDIEDEEEGEREGHGGDLAGPYCT